MTQAPSQPRVILAVTSRRCGTKNPTMIFEEKPDRAR